MKIRILQVRDFINPTTAGKIRRRLIYIVPLLTLGAVSLMLVAAPTIAEAKIHQ